MNENITMNENIQLLLPSKAGMTGTGKNSSSLAVTGMTVPRTLSE